MEQTNEAQNEKAAASDESVDAAALAKAKEAGAITADLMTRPSFMAAHTAMSFVPDSMKAYLPDRIGSVYTRRVARIHSTSSGRRPETRQCNAQPECCSTRSAPLQADRSKRRTNTLSLSPVPA